MLNPSLKYYSLIGSIVLMAGCHHQKTPYPLDCKKAYSAIVEYEALGDYGQSYQAATHAVNHCGGAL